MEVIFSDDFKKDLQKINDSKTKLKIIKQIRKIKTNPDAGKPLTGKLKGKRSLRVKPHRIIYAIESERIIVLAFGHRNEVYD